MPCLAGTYILLEMWEKSQYFCNGIDAKKIIYFFTLVTFLTFLRFFLFLERASFAALFEAHGQFNMVKLYE